MIPSTFAKPITKGARACDRDPRQLSNRSAPRAPDLLRKSPDMSTPSHSAIEDTISDLLLADNAFIRVRQPALGATQIKRSYLLRSDEEMAYHAPPSSSVCMIAQSEHRTIWEEDVTMRKVRRSIVLRYDVDKSLQRYLNRQGAKKGDLSRFVEDAIAARLFQFEVRAVKKRNQRYSQDEILEAIDEALAKG